jgi:hypothetical protein
VAGWLAGWLAGYRRSCRNAKEKNCWFFLGGNVALHVTINYNWLRGVAKLLGVVPTSVLQSFGIHDMSEALRMLCKYHFLILT